MVVTFFVSICLFCSFTEAVVGKFSCGGKVSLLLVVWFLLCGSVRDVDVSVVKPLASGVVVFVDVEEDV